MQGYSRYKIQKVQNKVAQSNISRGLYRAWGRAQTKLNRAKDKVWQENQAAILKSLQKSKYGNLLASGRAGKSIKRMGIMEASALGQYFAMKAGTLTNAREDFMRGVKFDRMKAIEASDNAFGKVAFAPTPDIAAPQAASPSIGMAIFADVMGVATSLGTAAIAKGSDSRLKEDIKQIGKSIDGHNIYKFKYLDDPTYYIGAMAEEVYKKKPSAVVRMDNGYLGVDYSQIDVEMKEVA